MPVAPTVTRKIGTNISRAGGRLHSINLGFLAVVALLVIYGLIIVSSATSGSSEYSFSRQLVGVGLGLVAMVICWRIDYRILADLLVPLLIIDVILLLSPHFPLIGVSAKGATSWISIFGQRFQPGEPAKILTIVVVASAVARYRGSLSSGREYLKVLGICALPFICIMLQPDLGSGLVILVISAAILFVGGANRKWLLITVAVAVVCIAAVLALDPLLDNMMGRDVFMKDYQMNRLLVFTNEDLDPTGAGYNLKQAKIAIGSGGFLGKGLGGGTQSSMGFLPEAPTDFIFCVLAEELGFVGSALLLLLYLALIFFAFDIASQSCDLFGSLIVTGVIGMWIFQILENIGMCCGLMPITGIPLPFMSFGSSFMLVNFMAVGMIMSIWRFRAAKSALRTAKKEH